MKARRGSTASPIRVVKISSAVMLSSIWARSRRRFLGSMVVSHNWIGFISPNPLYRWVLNSFSTSRNNQSSACLNSLTNCFCSPRLT